MQPSFLNFDSFIHYLNKANHIMWSHFLIVLLIGVGLFLTYRMRGVQFRFLKYSLKLAFSRKDDSSEGEISQFQALMTALAATIGIGSIAGVATAIVGGGLGSIFCDFGAPAGDPILTLFEQKWGLTLLY